MMKRSVVFSCIILTSLTLGYGQTQCENQSQFAVHSDSWFDSLNVRFVGNWPFGRAEAVVYDESRQLIFSGSGGGVYILDVSNPGAPILISTMIRTRGYVTDLYYDNGTQLLYTTGRRAGIEIWEVSEPSSPNKIGCLDTPGFCSGILVQDTIAFITDGYSGLGIIDVSDPSNPQEIIFYDTPDFANELFIADSLVYIADRDSGLRIINVSDPYNPFEVGYYSRPDTSFYSVFVVDSFAYVAASDHHLGVLLVFNVSNPSNPYVIGRCVVMTGPYNLYVSGSHAYVSNDLFTIVDISDPANPHVTSYYEAHTRDVYVSDSIAFLSASGLKVINVSDPANPQEIGFYDTRSYEKLDIYIQNTYGYVIDDDGGFWIIDISNPDSIQEIGHCYAPGFYQWTNVFVTDSHAFIVTGSIHPTFFIIDITDHQNPFVLSSLDECGSSRGLFVSDTLAYIAQYDLMRIINIADLLNPYQIGQYYAGDEINGIFVKNNYAYVATSTSLRIIDVNEPTNPVEIGLVSTYGYGNSDISVDNGYAYIANGNWNSAYGLYVADVHDPYNPQLVSSCSTHYQFAFRLRKKDDFVYLACGYGIEIINITDPSNPLAVGYYKSADWSYGIAVSNSFIFSADQACGVQVYENLLTGIEEGNTTPTKKENYGATIFGGPLLLPEGKNCKVFDIAGREVKPHLLQPGIYFIEIDGVIAKKVIKVR